jgi:hypothetical protein
MWARAYLFFCHTARGARSGGFTPCKAPPLRSQEWSIKEVFLTDDHGGVFKPITWLGKEPLPPDNAPHEIILEWQISGDEVKRPFALVVVGDDGRTVRVSRVVFPQ